MKMFFGRAYLVCSVILLAVHSQDVKNVQQNVQKKVPQNMRQNEAQNIQQNVQPNLMSKTKKPNEKPSATHSEDYEDPKRFKFSFQGEFRKRFGFYCTSVDPTRSTVCSPLAAMLPAGKLCYGADGPTLKELLKALDLKKNTDVFMVFKELVMMMSQMQGVHLDVASQMYFSHTKEISPHFASVAANTFASIGEYSNMADPENTVKQINNFVKKQTHGKIKRIVNPSDIKPHFRLILINGVYFTGNWDKEFTEVGESKFYTLTREIKVPMMNTIDEFHFGTSGTLDADIVQMPFSNGDVNFYLLLPHKRFGAEMVINKLRQAPKLLNLIEIEMVPVNVTMPRFKLETELDMIWLYKRSTITEVFAPKHGLRDLIPEETVYVDKAVHKTVIEIEDGGSAGNPPLTKWNNTDIKQMVANHPFGFIIAVNRHVIVVGFFNGEGTTPLRSTKIFKHF